MKPLAKNTAIVLTTAMVFVSSQAHAVAGQDNAVSGDLLSPTIRRGFCLGDNCARLPHIHGAFQGSDCNEAGAATPVPFVLDRTKLFAGSSFSGAYRGSSSRLIDPLERTPRFGQAAQGTAEPDDAGDARFFGYSVAPYYKSPPTGLFSSWSAYSDGVQNEQARSDAASAPGDVGVPPRFGINVDDHGGKPKIYGYYREYVDGIWFTEPPGYSRQGLNYEPEPFQFKFFPLPDGFGGTSWPAPGSDFSAPGADRGPISGTVDQNGIADDIELDWSFYERRLGAGQDPIKSTAGTESTDFNEGVREAIEAMTPAPGVGSLNFETPANGLNSPLGFFVNQQLDIGGTQFTSLMFEEYDRGLVINLLEVAGITIFENNGCRVVLVPTDPNFIKTGRGSWGQAEDDQWAIKRVGFTATEDSAWNQVPETASPVVVAVIDTGLDWHHLDISHENIWRNENEIADNGIDDDDNGYVDDVIGWNFLARNNKPWDFDGHGTVVAGIIAATQNNDAGIAGINPHAKIMVLKGVNNFGTTRASYLAEAIVYAADNGARVINISVGGPHTSRMEQAAIDYAHEKGVLVIAASGNDGIELDDFGPAGGDHVLTVGATHTDDRAAAFSNFGDKIDLVAPGVDVLSLRARYTDANYRPGNNEYLVGTNYVGQDKRYIHVSGTSFSTPIVAATASLLMAKNPALTAAEVQDLLQQTAEDIESPGRDNYSGYGMINARAALGVEPGFFVTAEITGVEPVETDAGTVLRIKGTIDSDGFKRAWMQIGAGENPGAWKYVGQKRKYAIHDGVLGYVPLTEFSGSDVWQVVINVEHKNGIRKSTRYPVRIN